MSHQQTTRLNSFAPPAYNFNPSQGQTRGLNPTEVKAQQVYDRVMQKINLLQRAIRALEKEGKPLGQLNAFYDFAVGIALEDKNNLGALNIAEKALSDALGQVKTLAHSQSSSHRQSEAMASTQQAFQRVQSQPVVPLNVEIQQVQAQIAQLQSQIELGAQIAKLEAEIAGFQNSGGSLPYPSSQQVLPQPVFLQPAFYSSTQPALPVNLEAQQLDAQIAKLEAEIAGYAPRGGSLPYPPSQQISPQPVFLQPAFYPSTQPALPVVNIEAQQLDAQIARLKAEIAGYAPRGGSLAYPSSQQLSPQPSPVQSSGHTNTPTLEEMKEQQIKMAAMTTAMTDQEGVARRQICLPKTIVEANSMRKALLKELKNEVEKSVDVFVEVEKNNPRSKYALILNDPEAIKTLKNQAFSNILENEDADWRLPFIKHFQLIEERNFKRTHILRSQNMKDWEIRQTEFKSGHSGGGLLTFNIDPEQADEMERNEREEALKNAQELHKEVGGMNPIPKVSTSEVGNPQNPRRKSRKTVRMAPGAVVNFYTPVEERASRPRGFKPSFAMGKAGTSRVIPLRQKP